MTAHPWSKFYWADWRSDPRLRMCGLAARGLWIEMLSLMNEAEPYGHLLVSGRAPTDTQLAMLAGAPPEQVTALLGELESAGVFSRTGKGVIYSRRMTRDKKKEMLAKKNGKNGGNPTLSKQRENQPTDNPTVNHQDKGADNTQSQSQSQIQEKEEGKPSSQNDGDLFGAKPKRGTRIPEGAVLPEEWQAFALSERHPDPQREWLKFTDYWRSQPGQKGVKLDWEATWRNWIRRAVENGTANRSSAGNRPRNGFVEIISSGELG